ncbi:major facilitator superfamily domain-containing protein [Suillus lakei]|nr:major facilitator superfamily domain-containing protein [Suillus lakei]
MSALSNAESEMGDTFPGVPNHARDDLERRLLRKLDLRMSITVVLYTLSFLDNLNMSSARLGGFEKDLHLQGNQYATVLSIVYVGYILTQVPSNMFLHWLEKPAILIPGCALMWGIMSVLTGFTKNYTGVLLARLFLGFTEGPFFAGALFLLSKWYKRDELALRIAIILCGSVFGVVFGSLLASGILTGMQGILGQAGWLFYIEGGATIIVAICAMFMLPNFPHNTRWLTPEERALSISRLADDGYEKSDELGKRTTMQGLWDAVSDWKVWWFVVALFAASVGQSFAIYLPTIAATMGYDTTVTLLLAAPPWVLATIAAFAIARYSDKKRKRFIFIFASNALAALGLIISICTMDISARYTSLFLMVQVTGGQVVFLGWINNTFAREPAKRAVAIAVISGLSQTGSILGSYVWPPQWGPTYRYSFAICFAALVVSTVMFGVMHLHLKQVNERIERDERNAKDMNDLRYPVGFRYLV